MGTRTQSSNKAFLHIEPTSNSFHTISGTLDCSYENLENKTIYLEIKDSHGTLLGTYAGRFEQQNQYGIYSLRYQNNLPATNAITFQLPARTVLSSKFSYQILLRDGDCAQVYSTVWN